MKKNFRTFLFPYDSVRKIQDDMILKVNDILSKGQCLVMHAPTGIGKTSILGPALAIALKNNFTVFFLTSRHTQHHIAIDTLKQIKEKYDLNFTTVDIIGKKWMCPIHGTDNLYSNEFLEYCKTMIEEGKCSFYVNTRKKSQHSTVQAKILVEELKNSQPLHIEELLEYCVNYKLCPYEISLMLAGNARVIVADYYYVFHPHIQATFFAKAHKKLQESIIIIDEAHNLPSRMRELFTEKISTFTLQRAINEAKKYNYKETLHNLKEIESIFGSLVPEKESEVIISRDTFINLLNEIDDYDKLIADFGFIGDEVREKQKQSSIGSIALFLEAWKGDEIGFVRIGSRSYYRGKELVSLAYRCLDPSLVTKNVFEQAYSVISMSGTLTPTSMYRDILGYPNQTVEAVYKSPFPEKNRMHLIIPSTTTKFTHRNANQFKQIAHICADITNLVPGNSALFFPSYSLRDEINTYFSKKCKKTTFLEMPRMNKKEKHEFLEQFKQYKDIGAVLMGVASGSFGEGIDLPGDFLKAVVVVGLPLHPPDLETKELINYYDNKFGKGWDYGYILPAITKALQNAGRCIRDETDRGIMIFLDERYTWKNYFKCFPIDWDVKITNMYNKRIQEFFS